MKRGYIVNKRRNAQLMQFIIQLNHITKATCLQNVIRKRKTLIVQAAGESASIKFTSRFWLGQVDGRTRYGRRLACLPARDRPSIQATPVRTNLHSPILIYRLLSIKQGIYLPNWT